MSAPQFHQLKVSEVEHLTDDAVALTFEIPTDLDEQFNFVAGHHVTVRAQIDDQDVRRSYSICIPPGQGKVRVGVRRISGGLFSTYATTRLAVGDVVDVMPPGGDFVLGDHPAGARIVAIAGGSGITPVLSMVSTALADGCHVTLLYGNRTSSSIMFLEELEELKDRYPTTFQLIHVLSREPQSVELFSGRLDPDRFADIFASLVPPAGVDGWYLCGPTGLVEGAQSALNAAGVSEDLVHVELFYSGDTPPLPPIDPVEAQSGSVKVGFTLDGRYSTVGMEPEMTLLDAAVRVRSDLPFACKGGMCATCKAHLVEGEVEMDRNFALVAEELDAGFILTCQSHPKTDTIEINYDI